MKKYLLISALVAGVALLCAAVGTSTLPIATRFNLGLVEPMVCSSGQTLEYLESAPYFYTDSEGTHRRADISIACVSADGTRSEGKAAATIGGLMGVYFLLCFIPLFILAVFLRKRLTSNA